MDDHFLYARRAGTFSEIKTLIKKLKLRKNFGDRVEFVLEETNIKIGSPGYVANLEGRTLAGWPLMRETYTYNMGGAGRRYMASELRHLKDQTIFFVEIWLRSTK